MSKGQRGNKEAKKPKKVPVPTKPLTPDGPTVTVSVGPPTRLKK